jgi:hypothetical protein
MNGSVFLNGRRSSFPVPWPASGVEVFCLEPGVACVFTDDDRKCDWLNTTGFSILYQRALPLIAEERRKEGAPGGREEERTAREDERTLRARIRSLLSAGGVSESDTVAVRTLLATYDRTRGANPLCTALYDRPKFQGDWRFLRHGIRLPDFAWIDFHDQVVSLRVFGETFILCRDPWYRGSRAWFGAYPYREYDLSGTGIAGASASALSF